jgi:hypothetical protein
MPQHVGSDSFQPSSQFLQRLAACDVPLTLCLDPQLLCGRLSQPLHRSLGNPLGDAYSHWLPFRRHRDSDQQPLPFLVTADGRQSFWTTNNVKIAAQQALGISMEWNTTRFPRLPASHGDRPTSQIQITQLQVTGFLHA